MGMPTVGAYIVLAVLVAPSLVRMGVEPLAAHLFIFYFGVISAITPPVCMAAFAAAAISGAPPMRTGLTAFRLAIAVFIVPFIMVYHPALIGAGGPLEVARAAATALIGTGVIAASLEGFLLRPMGVIERALALLGGLSLISGGVVSDLGGAALLAGVVVVQLLRRQAERRASENLLSPAETERGEGPR